MSEPPPLDLKSVAASTVPLQLALAFSAALGVVLGGCIIGFGIIVAMLAATAGLAGFALLAALTGVALTRLIVVAAAAILIIPAAAAIAARLKARHLEEFILRECETRAPANGSRMGEVLALAARRAGLETPPRYGVVEGVANAFAISGNRESGLVLLGRPLIEYLSPQETFAILGHEIGHVAMDDTRRTYLAMAHQEFLVRFLLWRRLQRLALTLFGFVGEIALAAYSREREYWADAVGAHVAGKEWMISALVRLHELEAPPTRLEKRYNALMVRPARALFASHPSFSKRIAALEDETYVRRLPRLGQS